MGGILLNSNIIMIYAHMIFVDVSCIMFYIWDTFSRMF